MKNEDSALYRNYQVTHSRRLVPEDLLNFVYLDEFESDWNDLFDEEHRETALASLEIAIMCSPENGDVIAGTGGLRKLRFGELGRGKRNSIRVCYAYFPEFHVVLMVMAYGKNRKENLSKNEKDGIRVYLAQVQRWLNGERQNEGTSE